MPDEVTPEQHKLGAKTRITGTPLVPDGQWDTWLPNKERQRNAHFDTINCTNYGTLNCLETLIAFHDYEVPRNFSERYTGVETGTRRSGNFPHKVIEIIRTESGVIPEHMLPFDESITSWEEYYYPNPMPARYKVEGARFLEMFRINHDWVFEPGDNVSVSRKQELLKEALAYSPIGVSVLAWKKRGDRYFKNEGESDTHWTMLFGYKDGEYWKIFDSYDESVKHLEWDYDFGYAKRYSITPESEKPNWVIRFFRALLEIITARV